VTEFSEGHEVILIIKIQSFVSAPVHHLQDVRGTLCKNILITDQLKPMQSRSSAKIPFSEEGGGLSQLAQALLRLFSVLSTDLIV